MSQIIRATYVDGVLRPDEPLAFPSMTRVRLIVEPLQPKSLDRTRTRS